MIFQGDPNIGLYGVATDKFCLVGNSIQKEDLKKIEQILKVPVFQVGLYGSELIGLFCVANSKTVLLPDIVYPRELKILKEKLKELDVSVHIIKTEHTALGNCILLNDKKCVISTVYDKKIFAEIKKILKDIDLTQHDIAETSIPGSVGKITNKGGIFSPNLSDAEIKKIEKQFGFEIGLGTVNMGNPFVSSGILANSFGFIIGGFSSGYEISRVDESLGFFKAIV
jgi:translation initiation factor 6